MAKVYRHKRKDNLEVFYIGMSSSTRGRAFQKYRTYRSKEWHAINDISGCIVEILADDLSDEDAIELEMFLIEEYGRKDLGLGNLVNQTDGGLGVSGLIKTTSDDTKKKIGDGNRGKIASTETRKKMSDSSKGRILSVETRNKMSVSKRNMTDETRKKMRNAKRNISDESRKKMSDASKGKLNNSGKWVNQYSLDNVFIKSYRSLSQALRETNIYHIPEVCRGERKTAGKFIWRFKTLKER